MKNEKRRLAVLFGGRSGEYAVSLQSAAAVLACIDPAQYEVFPIGITRQGEWRHYTGPYEAILADDWWADTAHNAPAVFSASPSQRGFWRLAKGAQVFVPLDLAFPVLHGQNGEDGRVQGLLELSGLPVAGCGTLSSALCMDKHRAHLLAHCAGVAVPRGVAFGRAERAEGLQQALQTLRFPLFVKPLRSGSSLGVSRAARPEELPSAIDLALLEDSQVLVEEEVEGFEVGCAILGNEKLTVGRVDEIELCGGVFDYEEKYTLKTAKIHLPARVDAAAEQRIQQAAVAVYRALGCRGFARVDLFLTPRGQIVFNEVNTIPGLTAHSRYPQMMQEAGLSLKEVVGRILRLAVLP